LRLPYEFRDEIYKNYGIDRFRQVGTLLTFCRDEQPITVSLPSPPKNLDELKTFLSTLFYPKNWQQAIRSFTGKAPIELKKLPHQS
jgi:hypothetical protein